MQLYNSLTHQIEKFIPINNKNIGVYTCGPTVYSYVTIGNWRTYFLGDLVVRTLKYLDYKVNYIMNITDVGHLTGDNLGDADTGEDRLEKAAKKENKTAWDLARMYTDDFYQGYDLLDLSKPKVFCKATDHIQEQIDMVKTIEDRGFAYKTSDGIYFDTAKYEAAGNIYGQLSNIDQIKEGARVEPNPEKKDPRDFALWKFSYPQGRDADSSLDDINTRRQMEWKSPWGLGFPGWHIECSAMSRKYLGDQFDIHIGGEDLRSTHHPNEIAQSECATGKKPFVKYWLHGAFLQVNGGRMGKSLGNAYTLTDIINRGFKPEHLRYFYLTGHYRQPLNFTWESLENAKKSFDKIVGKIQSLQSKIQENKASALEDRQYLLWKDRFVTTLANDFQMPQLLAIIWEMFRDEELSEINKLTLILDWDQILGLHLESIVKEQESKINEYIGSKTGIRIITDKKLSPEIIDLVDQRELARREKNWVMADMIRKDLENKKIQLKDAKEKVLIS